MADESQCAPQKLFRHTSDGNYTRARIVEHIKNNPGDHLNFIARTLGINHGTLEYHTDILLSEDVIEVVKNDSRGSARRSRYYLKGEVNPTPPLSEHEQEVIDVLETRSWTLAGELAEILGRSKATISYYTNGLHARGVIERKRIGKNVVFFYPREDSSEN